jgi:hypothetical protein
MQFIPFFYVYIFHFMKLSDIIHRLQQIETKHPGSDFTVQVTGRAIDDGEVCTVIGNKLVRFECEQDTDCHAVCLVCE